MPKGARVIELVPRVGDFVGKDEPLFQLHGAAAQISDRDLQGTVIFGSERTLEQDPLFAPRILVDIAIKALSAAINDPTTAVLAIDQLHQAAPPRRPARLRTDYVRESLRRNKSDFPQARWNDFVQLAFTEIGSAAPAMSKSLARLRAMIINLQNTLPVERHPALQQEAELLDRTIEKLYPFPEDLALARIPDTQGLGGSTETPIAQRVA